MPINGAFIFFKVTIVSWSLEICVIMLERRWDSFKMALDISLVNLLTLSSMITLISGHCLSESRDMISEAFTSPETVPGVTEYAFHRCVGDAPLWEPVCPSLFWHVRDASRRVSENPVVWHLSRGSFSFVKSSYIKGIPTDDWFGQKRHAVSDFWAIATRLGQL